MVHNVAFSVKRRKKQHCAVDNLANMILKLNYNENEER